MSISQVAQIHVKIRERTKLASLITPVILALQKIGFYPEKLVFSHRWSVAKVAQKFIKIGIRVDFRILITILASVPSKNPFFIPQNRFLS